MKTPNKTNSNPTGYRSVSLVLNSLPVIPYPTHAMLTAERTKPLSRCTRRSLAAA